MPRATLTDNLLKSRTTTGEFWDTVIPGLVIRLGPRKKTFFAARRPPGEKLMTWRKIGEYDAVTLAEARRKARDVLGAIASGDAPATAAVVVDDPAPATAPTFADVAEDFIRLHLPRLRSARAGEALIRRELLPVLGSRPIGEVRRRDIIALVEAIRARGAGAKGRPESGGEYAARHAFAQISKLFNWALPRDIEGLDANPCGGIRVSELLGRAKARTRVLSDDEVRAVWRAAGDMGQPFGAMFRLLLLTGQRENEIAAARWQEVDLDAATLTIPAERMKGGEAHVVPLTPAVVAMLAALPRFKDGEFVLTTTAGRRPISGFSKSKAQLDVLSGVRDYTIHDLRRTARTGLSVTGATPFIAELVMAHRQEGVHAVYDLHTYDDEKRAALARWEARLLSVVDPQPAPANVVPMVRA